MTKLTHLDEQGAARMVDVSDKAASEREATAEAVIVLSNEAFAAVASGGAPKGDVLAAARIAGIMAAKKTPELIPLCHSIALTKAEIAFEMLAGDNAIRILATAKTTARTGVEMEALTAASIAALTIYDMTKALDKSAVIESVRLLAKSGGKSGSYTAPSRSPSKTIKNSRSGESGGGRAKPATPIGDPRPRGETAGRREAFRAFMVSRRLRATEWAKAAGVPAAQIYAFLTGRLRALPPDVAGRLARAAQVRIEDMFR
ncbi:MAG: cyclic pyranopterin monophosphate synthase MoaC [Alphaproteobacteria bacterium]|nr:cyclic pyranopterin monophosphate synthase MoaC [Alphaproteobacteria bacterium]MDE2630680.1 cyclic pyranopterin monophosphate synthase MoaC [Alphaproteobacteria bacterium]